MAGTGCRIALELSGFQPPSVLMAKSATVADVHTYNATSSNGSDNNNNNNSDNCVVFFQNEALVAGYNFE